MYAIVDIETTGSYAAANGITEICIQIHDGTQVIEKFETLVNPIHAIPRYIQALTGITPMMVEAAPTFDEIAEQVYELLKDKIFVAHSVNFDYSFIKSQLAFQGYELDLKKLCTVRLSRKIVPGLASYSLGRLCEALHIPHYNKHRAGGDTDATVALFELLLQKDTDEHIQKSLKRNSKEFILPPNVPKEDFEKLPYTPGVYYFHDEKGSVVYVGKAKNLKYRVNSHFSNNATTRQKQNFLRYVHNISFEECGTELVAAVKESTEIKKLWPKFNAAQKKREDSYGVVQYIDQNGYLRLGIDRMTKGGHYIGSFHRLESAKAALRQLIEDYELCPKLCFVSNDLIDDEQHDNECKGACKKRESTETYNLRVEAACNELIHQPSFAIIDKGVERESRSCILVWKGSFYGMGLIAHDTPLLHTENFKELVKPYKENSSITNMLFNYAKRYPNKIVWLDK